MSRAFINLLKKDVLSNSLRELGISDEGSVEDMRSRLRTYLDKDEIPPEHEAYIQNLRSRYEASRDIKIPSIQISRASSPVQGNHEQDCNSSKISEVCDKVRKWGVKYDGGKEPLCFLERIEELARCYSIPENMLLNYLPELLKGDALAWYRNNKSQWKIYKDFVEDFKLFFLPNRFFENLDDEIRTRVQKVDECFVNYVTAIQSLMRWSKLTTSEQLERIYKNCRAEYKIYVKRGDFCRLQDLIILAQEYEYIRAEENKHKKIIRRVQSAVAAPKSNYICFRCGEPGHSRASCSNPQVLFCWDCGKRNVKTIDCCRSGAENSNRGPSVREREEDL